MIDIINKLKIGDPVPVPPAPKTEAEIMGNWKGDLSQPQVSIVCHTYNHVNYIKDALNGFLMQETDFPFEIIVHDDASTDGTTEIVKKYAEDYPNIIVTVIQSENKWSKGIMPRFFTFPKVRGKYIALCEGDDYWVSAIKLNDQINSFECGVSLVFHDAIRCEDSLVSSISYYEELKSPIMGYKPFQMARGYKTPTASAVFLSKPFIGKEQINVINGDHLIWATLASFGSAKFIPERWSIYRHHPGGVWSARKVIDKVRPALKSKSEIFEMVSPELKTSALIGYCSMCLELIDGLLEVGYRRQAHSVVRLMLVNSLGMGLRCQLKSARHFKDLALLLKIILKLLPVSLFKRRY